MGGGSRVGIVCAKFVNIVVLDNSLQLAEDETGFGTIPSITCLPLRLPLSRDSSGLGTTQAFRDRKRNPPNDDLTC